MPDHRADGITDRRRALGPGWLLGGPPDELLRLEVRELTGLLRHADSFAGLRGALASKGIPASEVILAGLIESEDESRYGVMLTPGQECILFETARDDSLTRWEIIDDPRTLGNDFEAVLAGIACSGAREDSSGLGPG